MQAVFCMWSVGTPFYRAFAPLRLDLLPAERLPGQASRRPQEVETSRLCGTEGVSLKTRNVKQHHFICFILHHIHPVDTFKCGFYWRIFFRENHEDQKYLYFNYRWIIAAVLQ